MQPPYRDVVHALRRAFSSPAPRLKPPSIWGTGPRSWGALTPEEIVAIDGYVQAQAIQHCHPRIVRAMRIQWEEDAVMAAHAVQAQVDTMDKALPPEMLAQWMQKWARRRLFDIPVWPYTKWAQVTGIDRGAISQTRRELCDGLTRSLNDGIRIMQPVLWDAGLVSNLIDRACG